MHNTCTAFADIGVSDSAAHMKYYFDRRDAGRDLARDLKGHAGRSRVIVLALSPGGVPVAWEIASALRAPRFTPSPPSPQAGVVTRIGGEHPKSADAKVVTGLLVIVFLEVVLAGCPPRKPTPIAHDSYASYARLKTVFERRNPGGFSSGETPILTLC